MRVSLIVKSRSLVWISSIILSLSLGLSHAHEMPAPGAANANADNAKNVKMFRSLTAAQQTFTKVTQLFFQEKDAQAFDTLDPYSSIQGNRPSQSFLKSIGISKSKKIRHLRTKNGPVPNTAIIYYFIATDTKPVLMAYYLYSPKAGQWRYMDFQLTENIPTMLSMLKP